MEPPRMEPDGRTKIVYIPDMGIALEHTRRALMKLEAEALEASVRMLAELGETPTFDIPLRVPPPKNWRPWHQHTLPNRRRR